jgi:hypothetical protein
MCDIAVRAGTESPSHRQLSKREACGRFTIGKKILPLLTGITILASACGLATETIWSIEVPSPDGQWIASGRTDQTSGPGNADLSTGVYLRRSKDSGRGENVLIFENEPASSKLTITLKLVWLTPSHLEVIFNRIPDFESQTVKYAGIDISVRDSAGANRN